MDLKEIQALIKFVAKSGAQEVSLETEDFKQRAGSLRGSIMIVGPLLARFGKGFIPKPGGDKIGRRRLDTHFIGFEKLGAKFNYDDKNGFFEITVKENMIPTASVSISSKSTPTHFFTASCIVILAHGGFTSNCLP